MTNMTQDQFRELAELLHAEQGHRFCWHGGRWWWHDGEVWTRYGARAKLVKEVVELGYRLPDNAAWGKIKHNLGGYYANNQVLGKAATLFSNDYGLPCPPNPPATVPEPPTPTAGM